MLIGVATSISKDKNFDAFDTLEYAKENNIKIVQIYLNEYLINNHQIINEITLFASENNINLTCHLPDNIYDDKIFKNCLESINKLLCFQRERKVIFHFDENKKKKYILSIIEKFNKNHIIPCIENFYQEKHNTELLLDNITKYNSIFSETLEKNQKIIPVFDLPRLFHTDILQMNDSLYLTKNILSYLALLSVKIIFHIIDFIDYSQERNTWCTTGEGIMPYNIIFTYIKKNYIETDHIILEYEDKDKILASTKKILSFIRN